MKALVINRTGSPKEVIEYLDVARPQPGPKEVLIKVIGSTINPADTMFIQGKYRFNPVFPQTVGLEGAGIIIEVGEGVKTTIGSLAAFMHPASWAEYIVVPEEELFILPSDFPPDKSVQFCINPLTAWGLLEESKVKTGDWVLLTAGNSAVSKIAIQLARSKNIHTVAVIRNPEQTHALKILGADEVLIEDDMDFQEKIYRITEGEGVNAALDAVGGKTGTKVLQSMASGGKVIIYGRLSSEPVQFYNGLIIFKNISIAGFGIRGYLSSKTCNQKLEITQALVLETLKPSFQLPVFKSYGFEHFQDAFDSDELSYRNGKVIFKLNSRTEN